LKNKVRKPKKEHLEYLGINGRIILGLTLKEQGVKILCSISSGYGSVMNTNCIKYEELINVVSDYQLPKKEAAQCTYSIISVVSGI
jgi:hypothetical protein